MKRLAGVLLISIPLLLNGCTGRHFVVERDDGRVDGARSVTTKSDEQWTIEAEPEQKKDPER